MYTINDFLVDLTKSTVWYRIPVSKVCAETTEDLLHRHVIEGFSDLGLKCDGFNVEKINRVYYLSLTVDLDTDYIDDSEYPFDETSMAEFSKVSGDPQITIPRKFTDEVYHDLDGYDCEHTEVEFVFYKFQTDNPKMLKYIKLG